MIILFVILWTDKVCNVIITAIVAIIALTKSYVAKYAIPVNNKNCINTLSIIFKYLEGNFGAIKLVNIINVIISKDLNIDNSLLLSLNEKILVDIYIYIEIF